MKQQHFLILCVCLLTTSVVNADTPEEWKSRTIYQLLTDRFSQGSEVARGFIVQLVKILPEANMAIGLDLFKINE